MDGPFPTCVGMNRFLQKKPEKQAPVPHMRGDEPRFGGTWQVFDDRSPHAWG